MAKQQSFCEKETIMTGLACWCPKICRLEIMFPSRSLPSEYSWGAMLIFPSWRERVHWVVLNVNCMNFCTFSFSSCLLRRRRICPNIAKACCYAGLAYKQHLIKISLSNLMCSRIMWFLFILYWVWWSHFITTNIFNNILKCEFLGLTSSAFPIDEAQAMRCFGYIFVLSPVSLVWAVTTSVEVKIILICSSSCLYTENQILVLELSAVMVAGIATLLKDEVGCCWVCWSTFVSYPALELHGKHYCRTACRCCHCLYSNLSFFPPSTERTQIKLCVHKSWKNHKMQVWDLVIFPKPTHICIVVVLHVKTLMFLD